jgi:protein-disulfide isomerase
VSDETQTNETFSMSRDVVNAVIVGIVFMVGGVLLGMAIAGDGLTASDVRGIVADELDNTLGATLNDTLVAVLSETSGGAGLTSEDVRAVVREEVAVVAGGEASGLTAEEVRAIVSEEVTASGGGGEAISSEELEAIVVGALANAERERNYLADDDAYIGDEDAPVVIVEFSDYLCSFCGRHFEQTLEPLLENFDGYIRYVYRDNPGVGGQNAVRSALASECAQDQGYFWEMHDVLFSNQSALGTGDLGALNEILIGFAEDIDGMDVETFTTCLESEQHINDIIVDSSDAQSVGARGTPAFLINGRFISGAQPYEVFEQLILRELADAGITYEPPTES